MTHLFLFKRLKTLALFLAICLGINFNAKAQNLVLNPSFESVNAGSLQCSWYTSSAQFNNAINNWTCPTGGSTDIFNTALATTCYCSPFSTHASSVGQQAPRTGNGFVNIVTFGNGGCDPWREYVQGELSSALVVGQTYEVEMWVSLADNMTVGTNNIGVKFSTAPYAQGSNCGYYTTPDVNYTGPIIIDKTAWTQIIFCYTPTQAGLQNFIIGNFFNDAATTTQAAGGGTGNTIRYFVDDVRIELVPPGGGDPGTDGTTSLCISDPNVNLFSFLGGTPDATGTWTGPSALTGGNLGTFDPSTNLAGVYTYTVAGGAGPCVAAGGGTATVTVTLSGFDATVTPAGPFCDTDPAIIMTAVDAGGTWSGTGITNTTTGAFDPAMAGVGTHTITYSITGACGDVQTTDVIVSAVMDATITAAGPFCVFDVALNLTAVDAGGVWTGTGITDGALGTFDPATAGLGTHTITYTIAGACGDVQTTNITVNASLDATITPAGPFCDSDVALNLSAVDAGGLWSGTGITDVNLGTFDPSSATIGNNVITYTLGGACGDVQTETIVINASADATITAAGPFCDSDAALNLAAVDAGGIWTGTGITDGALGTFDPSAAGVGTHTITYTIAGACGDVQTTNIIVNVSLDATITPAGPFCDSDVTLNLSAVDAGGLWSGTGITDVNLGTFDPSAATIGNNVITYTLAGACGDVQTETIVINASADATITPAGPFCDTDVALNLTAVDAGGTWTGIGITDGALGTFNPSAAGVGTHTITYDIVSACGDLQTTDIIVNLTPDATITAAGPFCESDATVQLAAVDAGGVWSGNGITDATNGSFDPATAAAGTHTITYSINGSCPINATTDIVVNPNPSLANLANQNVCEGSNIMVQAFNPNPISATVDWVNTTGVDVGFGLNGNGDIGNFVGVNGTNTSITVQLAVTPTSIEGCVGPTVNFDITVNPTPNVQFYGTPLVGCEPLEVWFYNNTTLQGQSCVWDFGDGTTASNCDSIVNTYNAGIYDVSLTVTTAAGCTDSDAFASYIDVSAQPIALFGFAPQVLTVDDTEVQFSNNSVNADAYYWDFGDNSATSIEENPSHFYPQVAGTYTVTLWAYNSGQLCVDSIQKQVIIEDIILFYVPNIFTPDGDEFNETFSPVFTSGFDPYDFHLIIFNRWGEIIFESYNALEGWDGHFGDGGLVEDGTYIWQVDFKETKSDKRYTHRGHITVLK